MASIIITTTEIETTYQRVGGGYTSETYSAPAQGVLPAPVAEAMGLLPCGFDDEGFVTEYTLAYPLMDEKIVHPVKKAQTLAKSAEDSRCALMRQEQEDTQGAGSKATGEGLSADGEKALPALVRAGDGTVRPEGYDWKLGVRPEAVTQAGCRLRGEGKETYIETPEPATTKAAFRWDEHTRATMLVYRAEKRRVA